MFFDGQGQVANEIFDILRVEGGMHIVCETVPDTAERVAFVELLGGDQAQSECGGRSGAEGSQGR